eukprot:1108309-Prorocentrum_minimum.AAC.1
MMLSLRPSGGPDGVFRWRVQRNRGDVPPSPHHGGEVPPNPHQAGAAAGGLGERDRGGGGGHDDHLWGSSREVTLPSFLSRT